MRWSRKATRSLSTPISNCCNFEVGEAEIEARRAQWKQPPPRYTRGVLAKFAKLAKSASEGAVTD
ncbi:dihydroxy-acid dehydratase [Phyllobacterium sp. A18/5-2]|nr:dihydroxy-acid dehydratase [Phyllobacterium sp. A18/5-2]